MANNIKIARKANVYQVLEIIRKEQSVTIEQIMTLSGLSRPTVITIIKELQESDKVIKSGLANADIGRQPVLYSLNTAINFAIGIDVDGPPVNLVISDINGDIVYHKTWDIDLYDEAKKIALKILEELDKGIKAIDIEYQNVWGIAVGLPASIDIKNNRTVRLSRIKNWNNYPLEKDISEHTGRRVHIRNDAHLISIAEHEISKQAKNSLYVVLRSGIGMSAIINNEPYEGEMGNAGYIGHTILKIDGRACDCGLSGCLETYCSKRAIVEDYLHESNKRAKYSDILVYADAGDDIAINVLKKAGECLGVGISNMIKAYEIFTIILGDIECDEDHIFVKSIINSTKKNIKNMTNHQPNFIIGKLNRNNFGLGGCYFILSKFFALPKLFFKDNK